MRARNSERMSGLERFLSLPVVDRLIAAVAFAPFGFVIWEILHLSSISIENLLLVLQLSVLAVTMLTRRPPRRITHNPIFWILAVSATYWPLYSQEFYSAGQRVAPQWASLGVSIVGFIIAIWARFTLGRNIGFVPAQREIVAHGIYRFVRHPIYTAIFLGIIADEMAAFSWRNVALDVFWASLFIIKSFVEESFLADSSEYADYKRRTRWRWFPGIA